MNSDDLIAKRYEDIIKTLPYEDAEHVVAYVKDKLAKEFERGKQNVRDTNFLKVFGAILLAGAVISAVGFQVHRVLGAPVCPPVIECPITPQMTWTLTSSGFLKYEDDSKVCLYRDHTMTCWMLDAPPTEPISPPSP